MTSDSKKQSLSWLLSQDTKKKPDLVEERAKWFAGFATGGTSSRIEKRFPVMSATSVPKEYFDECRDALRFVYDKVKDDEDKRSKFQTFCESHEKFIQLALSDSPGLLDNAESE